MATVQQKVRLWFHESKPIVTVQRRFCLEYRNCHSTSKNSIKLWYEQFKGTGDVQHRKALKQHEGYSGTNVLKLNCGQVTRTTPELTPTLSPDFSTAPAGERLLLHESLTCTRSIGTSVFLSESGFESKTLWFGRQDFTTRLGPKWSLHVASQFL
ncbi:hypothetical protein AVEN_116860-1 [Araneus ventricosus]|uniref:DUF4817 domain-containing protein n=1 Tax=Araneus ventricosus TaxID=182803 RepID=A0A4Y2WA99_ARAVE|nr:hypothetical protein AVEN_226425-1 [Araneus ventricosus]GBO32929.1 hypothetical protein AVEN_116860-1 [Araneus ventricosus]